MSRLMKTMLTSLVILLLVGATVLVVVLNQTDNKFTNAEEEPSIEKVVEYSYETSEITTDLDDGSFVRIQFQILTDGKRAKKEISQRDFQLKNILIKELAIMEEKDFKSGLTELEETLTTKLNDLMTRGKVTDVYTINKILQ